MKYDQCIRATVKQSLNIQRKGHRDWIPGK